MKDFAVPFAEMRSASLAAGEHNDCTVIATALVTGWSYEDARRYTAELGRKPRSGFRTALIAGALERDGFGVTPVPAARAGGAQYTMTTIGRRYRSGRYFVRVKQHVAALIDGQVLDWTAGRRHRVTHVWKVEGSMPPPWLKDAPTPEPVDVPPSSSATMPRSQMSLF